MARLNEKVNDLENKLKQKDHELEMISSQVNEDVTTKTRYLQKELEKAEEERRRIEEELVKVQRDKSCVQHKVEQDQAKLNEQV